MAPCFDYVVLGGGIVGSAIADGLSGKGFSVALVERGAEPFDPQLQAKPIIECPRRVHLGSGKARNHVLGGNGQFWGGGLIRPPSTRLQECLGLPANADQEAVSLDSNFANVERLLNICCPPARAPFVVDDPTVGICHLAEIMVLPSSRRNISAARLERFLKNSQCEVVTCAETISFSQHEDGAHDRNIAAITIKQGSSFREIHSKSFVIAAGMIDSNLMVLKHAVELGLPSPDAALGSHLHEHLSVPVARAVLSSRRAKDMVAPRFANGFVVGRRFEFKCNSGWGAGGFLHFAMEFDELSPYREIKQLLSLRQQQASYATLLKAAVPLFAVAPEILKIAFERIAKRQLYLADRLSVSATIDFESFAHPDNRLQLLGNRAELFWDIAEEDEASYLELLNRSYALLNELSHKYGIQLEYLVDPSSKDEAIKYLHAAAIDAFHLGGGLQVALDGSGAVDLDLRLVGTKNVFVVSSAVLNRPGVVNPTHTLLALADRFVNQQQ